jgi:hypothetical protein
MFIAQTPRRYNRRIIQYKKLHNPSAISFNLLLSDRCQLDFSPVDGILNEILIFCSVHNIGCKNAVEWCFI